MLRPSENLEDKSRGFSVTISTPSLPSSPPITAHEGSIGGLSLSAVTRGLLATAGHDEMLHVSKVKDDGSLDRVHAEKLALGALQRRIRRRLHSHGRSRQIRARCHRLLLIFPTFFSSFLLLLSVFVAFSVTIRLTQFCVQKVLSEYG